MSEECKSVRLSDAFPPDSVANCQYVSDCHYLLKDFDVSRIKAEDIVYRPVKYKSDMNQIKKLHQEWFPINYSQEYYDQVFKGNSVVFTSDSHLTMVAEIKITLPTGRKEQIIIGSMFYRFRVAKRQYMALDCKDLVLTWLGVH
jgi:hypothetical protein